MNPGNHRVYVLGLGRTALLAALAVSGIATAEAAIRVELDFTAPTVSDGGNGTVFVSSPECVTFNEPGLPLLPARGAVVLLPPGETVTAVRVRTEGFHALDGSHLVAAAQEPQPIGRLGPYPLTEPDPAVYGSDDAFPAAAARLVTEQKGWGHGLAFLRVFPVAYRPLSGELTWFERVIVEVDTALPKGADARRIPRLRKGGRAFDRLSILVANPQDLVLYEEAEPAPLAASTLDSDRYPYVIVTSAALADAFRPVADFQSSRGLRARVVTVEEILAAAYAGCDLPEMIRQFVIEAYENWGTEYVLLGGDAEVVPPRLLSALSTSAPGDCYFEGLDGTWNDDGDARWGEPGEEDLVGEIAVGRASVDFASEVENWRHKNESYTERPVVSQVKKALFVGEVLVVDPLTSGDDMMDEIKDGADTCGYTTAGYPADYDRRTLYDRDGTWDKLDLIPLINEGFPTLNHAGHSTWAENMRMAVEDIALLTNDGVNSSYMQHYTIGCNAGEFDHGGGQDCFCEALVNGANGSAASVCNSREGYFTLGTTCGPSQHFHRQFVDARYGEGIVAAGRRNVDSKADLVWMLDDVMLHVHYELNLFGDPALPHWADVLGELALEHSGKYSITAGSYAVTVTAGGVPVPGATVTMYSDDFSVWASGETDDAGAVLLEPSVRKPMTLRLKAVKADHLPATDDVSASRK